MKVAVLPSDYYDRHQRISAIICLIITAIGLLFLCVGVGTPSWHLDYDGIGPNVLYYTNFFYTCSGTNGTCWNNPYLMSNVNTYSQPITPLGPVSTDYYLRLRNAAGLSIVGLLFVVFGLIGIIFLILPRLRLAQFNGRLNLIAAVLLAIAALFQRAALSEGQRQFTYNGYSANLYQTGHALTIVAVPLSAFIAGRKYGVIPIPNNP